jgi:hypothetical protein
MKTLTKLKTKEKFLDGDFFVFDTETTPFKLNETQTFIFGVVYGYGYKKVIYTKKEFQEEFEKPMYTKKKVFAHNAQFDLTVLYDNIYDLDKEAIFNGNFICCSNGNCMFADSLNIFPTSVAKIGEMLGKAKGKLSPEFWDLSEVTQKDIDYCIRDCEIVYDALLSIFETVGAVKITLASLSLDLFRRKYLKYHIDFDEKNVNMFFNSYYGGRCEAFYIGKTEACVYDINSMYPDAMYNCVFPNPKYLKRRTSMKVDVFIKTLLKDFEGCALIKVKHHNTTFGFLPFRKDGKLLFPIGEFEAYYNFTEIRFALKNNAIEIIEVKEVIYSVRMESIFKEFVLTIYNERRECDNEFHKYQLKIILNSLYGKFAQKINTEYVYIHDMTKEFLLIEEYKASGLLKNISIFNEFRNDCFLELCNTSTKYMNNTIPLFSSYITSHSRIKLLENLIKYEKNKPRYCDTDSIFFEIDPQIENSNELGAWKKENKIIIEINGLKNYDYICEGKTNKKIKGIPKSATLENGVYTYYNLLKTKESLRRNIKSGTYVERKKENKGRYDKRVVLENGETRPIEL